MFSIGGHSHTHQILSMLSPPDLDFEIDNSLELLEKNLGRKIRHYAYPEGQRRHFNGFVIRGLKARGIQCCPSAMYGINSYDEDLFQLKRIMVGFMNCPFPYAVAR